MLAVIKNFSLSERFTLAIITVLLFTGLISPFEYNLLPATAVFEIIFFIVFLFSLFELKNTKKTMLVYAILSSLYLISCMYTSVYVGNDNIYDFLQAFKCFYYIFCLSFICNRKVYTAKWVEIHLTVCLSFFILKYVYSKLGGFDFNLSERPAIWYENNYELIYLAICYIYYVSLGGRSGKIFLAFTFLVIISGSRSAVLSLFFCFIATYIKEFGLKTVIGILLSPIILMIGLSVFYARLAPGDSIEDIDRVRFLMFFLDETYMWSFSDFFFGAKALTMLTNDTCYALRFYENLFSFEGDGSCYSVILHSFILRVIFDHGILGLFFVASFYWLLFKNNGVNSRINLCLIGVMFSSALSVSSFNNVYVALAAAFIVSGKKE